MDVLDEQAASEVEEDASKKDKEGRMTTNKVRLFSLVRDLWPGSSDQYSVV